MYTNVESVRKPFLKRVFNEDKGDLYEGMINDFREGFHKTFEVKDGAGKKMKSIRRVVEALDVEGDEKIDALGRAIDLDQFINFWVLEIISGHWDGYNGNLNNFFVYSGKRRTSGCDLSRGGRMAHLLRATPSSERRPRARPTPSRS